MKLRSFFRETVASLIFLGTIHLCLGQDATVRGKLVRQGQAGAYPVSGIQVILRLPVGTGGTKTSAPSVTGTDGMYYFSNIPVGDYIVEVETKPPINQPIHVSVPYTDVPQILVP